MIRARFGSLFAAADDFDALVGVLESARRHGLVSYDGEALFKGVNDDTIIMLLKVVVCVGSNIHA